MCKRNERGFTVIELLIVIAIILLLAGLSLPVFGKIIEAARRSEAREMVHQVADCWTLYLNDYRTFPTIPLTEMDTNTMAILIGPSQGFNTQSNRYMEFNSAALANGLRDHWGGLFQIALDNGMGNDPTPAYDNIVEAPPHGRIRKNVAVWSKGKKNGLNGQPDDPADDIESWYQ